MEARRLFQEASDLLDVERKSSKTMWGQFWASHQRFFKYLCIAAKVPQAIRLAKKALLEGKVWWLHLVCGFVNKHPHVCDQHTHIMMYTYIVIYTPTPTHAHSQCVVIGLQSTGEARTLEQLEQNDGELSGFISTAKYAVQHLVEACLSCAVCAV